jgi:uncharacterized protein (TIGR02679 family)
MDTSMPQVPSNVQKAVTFFKEANLARVLAQLREKYIERGRVGGQIMLLDSATSERREIASFLGRTPYPEQTIPLRLIDIDNALRHSGFACTLPELLAAFFPDQPLITRPQKRAVQVAAQTTFREALHAIAVSLPSASRGRAWLERGQHGEAWLFSRFKNATAEEQERQLATIRYIATMLDQLPGTAAPERLALFAQRTSGDPHRLDPGRAAGRLLLLALSDRSDTAPASPPQDRAQELRLYHDAGLITDTISSSVAVFNLASATLQDGRLDPWVEAAGERVMLLPLRQLLAWSSVCPSGSASYVLENPQVFEEVVEGLEGKSASPTIICTAGWPSRAALTLLDLLLTSSSSNHCYYSGDFDLKGLQIAAYLLARYPGRCHLWQMESNAYTTALQHDGVTAGTNELEQLSALPTLFAPLVASIQQQKKWAYQEGIADLLIASICLSKDTR